MTRTASLALIGWLQGGAAEPITIVCFTHRAVPTLATLTLGHPLEADIRKILAVTFLDPPAKLVTGETRFARRSCLWQMPLAAALFAVRRSRAAITGHRHHEP